MMEAILEELSPAEYWVWGWLSNQWLSKGSPLVEIGRKCRPAFYSRRQLIRLIRGLEKKNYLMMDHAPKNQYQGLVVVIDPRKCLDTHVRATSNALTKKSGQTGVPGQECQGNGVLEGVSGSALTRVSGRCEGGNPDESWPRGSCPDMGVKAPPQLSLSLRFKESLKAWTEMGQGELMRRIKKLSREAMQEIKPEIMKLAPWPRSGRVSEQAKLYAAVRYLQSGGQARKSPEAWVEGVARRAQRDLEAG